MRTCLAAMYRGKPVRRKVKQDAAIASLGQLAAVASFNNFKEADWLWSRWKVGTKLTTLFIGRWQDG